MMKGKYGYKLGKGSTLFDYVFEELYNAGCGEKADNDLVLTRLALGYSLLVDFLADKGIIQQEDLNKVFWGWNTFEMEDSENFLEKHLTKIQNCGIM